MQHEVVARAESGRGEVTVRRRRDDAGEALELRVNGVFVMDTAETTTERLLAEAALAHATWPARVLVGGLGLGFSTRALLTDDRVERVLVAELEAAVVGWMREGVLPGDDVLADPRVRVVVDDVRAVVRAQPPRSFDILLLDVDNGPDFLVHDRNAALYAEPFLHEVARVLDHDGVLAVWSSTESAALAAALRTVYGACGVEPVPVDLQGRAERYWLFTGRMAA